MMRGAGTRGRCGTPGRATAPRRRAPAARGRRSSPSTVGAWRRPGPGGVDHPADAAHVRPPPRGRRRRRRRAGRRAGTACRPAGAGLAHRHAALGVAGRARRWRRPARAGSRRGTTRPVTPGLDVLGQALGVGADHRQAGGLGLQHGVAEPSDTAPWTKTWAAASSAHAAGPVEAPDEGHVVVEAELVAGEGQRLQLGAVADDAQVGVDAAARTRASGGEGVVVGLLPVQATDRDQPQRARRRRAGRGARRRRRRRG